MRCNNLAQGWMKLDDFNHELPSASNAGQHVWVEVISDDGDVDGQLMTVQRASKPHILAFFIRSHFFLSPALITETKGANVIFCL